MVVEWSADRNLGVVKLRFGEREVLGGDRELRVAPLVREDANSEFVGPIGRVEFDDVCTGNVRVKVDDGTALLALGVRVPRGRADRKLVVRVEAAFRRSVGD
ncbi:hypothetical protein [Natronococcus sp. JC468]|uniref:hypothetical protein n=1 Tax=Natronococcus sp. JC468 TaxID=1961921 RepID=UPI001AE0CE4D|nr:hypothetical protein [Natronococcus sp. JC468]